MTKPEAPTDTAVSSLNAVPDNNAADSIAILKQQTQVANGNGESTTATSTSSAIPKACKKERLFVEYHLNNIYDLDNPVTKEACGFVYTTPSTTLSDVRATIENDFADPPSDFMFHMNHEGKLFPIAPSQESDELAQEFVPQIVIADSRFTPNIPVLKSKKTDDKKKKKVHEKVEGFEIVDVKVKNPCTKEIEEVRKLKFSREKNASLCQALRSITEMPVFYDAEPEIDVNTFLSFHEQIKKHVTSYPSLEPLVKVLDVEFEDVLKKMQTMLEAGDISYNALWYYFNKDCHVVSTGKKETQVGFAVNKTKYVCSFFGSEFRMSGTVVKTDGTNFYSTTHTVEIQAFEGLKKLEALPVRKMTLDDREYLSSRGEMFNRLGVGKHYMQYTGNIIKQTCWSSVQIKADGRVMCDGKSFKRHNPNYRGFSTSDESSKMNTIPERLILYTWPTVLGFSFAAKKWGEIQVEHIADICFDDNAFDRLVLDPKKKALVQSLVTNSDRSFNDIIQGKGGGCIFLLHGTPGTGKTLTSEAIAELLHRPLYSVSVGELGVTTTELEEKLRTILEVASYWNAVILIDEADIFLEKRTENDINRNALVGIFLRLLEYHQGVLFLTTNRVKCFDEAFHSRISVALKYKPLDENAREQVWANLLDAAGVTGLNSRELAKYNLNGRQIKTTIRLAQSLAYSEDVPVGPQHIQATVEVSQQFQDDLNSTHVE
eukprot:GFYU01001190.1.p1 GENE.GFYU01001190.1~~GFYU01001190.1.p1  ORF type:complete len:723 (+),score=273.76 GFYU01001190.1:26-2170(+)